MHGLTTAEFLATLAASSGPVAMSLPRRAMPGVNRASLYRMLRRRGLR